MKPPRISCVGVVVGLVLGCGSSSSTGGCNTSSDNTVLFDPPLTEPGDYTFTVEIGEDSGECDVTMTAEGAEAGSCTPSSWSVLMKVPGNTDGDVIEPGKAESVLGLLVGTDDETEVTVTVSMDGEERFDDTLPLEPDTVEDSECGEVERLLATAEIP